MLVRLYVRAGRQGIEEEVTGVRHGFLLHHKICGSTHDAHFDLAICHAPSTRRNSDGKGAGGVEDKRPAPLASCRAFCGKKQAWTRWRCRV